MRDVEAVQPLAPLPNFGRTLHSSCAYDKDQRSYALDYFTPSAGPIVLFHESCISDSKRPHECEP
jgi:hypothetical protein